MSTNIDPHFLVPAATDCGDDGFIVHVPYGASNAKGWVVIDRRHNYPNYMKAVLFGRANYTNANTVRVRVQ